MTQDNPSLNPNSPDPSAQGKAARTPLPPSGAPAAKPPAKVKRRWLRRTLIGVGILVVLLLILVLLAPTIASTGAARLFVVGKINQNLNGKLEIANWSIGWTGGIRADGIKVFDEKGVQILQIPHVSTQLSLLGAIRGQYHLGNTIIDGLDFDAVREPDGTLNFAKLAKSSTSSPATKSSASTPSTAKSAGKLPDVDGDLQITNGRGTFQDDMTHHAPMQFTTIAGEVKIPSINQAISDSLKIAAKVGNQSQPGVITLDGTLLIARSNQLLAANQMDVHQKLGLKDLDAESLEPFLPPSLGITTLAGMTAGDLGLDLAAGQAATIEGSIASKNFRLGGPILKGDTYPADSLTLNIPKSIIDMSSGLGGFENYRLKVGAGAAGKDAITLAAISPGGGKTLFTLAADITPGMLQNLKSNRAPGGNGMLHETLEADIAPLANALPHMFSVGEGRKLTGGHVSQSLNVAMSATKSDVQEAFAAHDIAGENVADHQPIKLQPIDQSLKTTILASGGAIPDVRNLVLLLTTGSGGNGGYASADVKAADLSDLNAQVHIVLDKMQAELGQLFDFHGMQLAGLVDLTSQAKGGLIAGNATTGDNGASDVTVNLTGTNLVVKSLQNRSAITLTRLAANFNAKIQTGTALFAQGVAGGMELTGLSTAAPNEKGLHNEQLKATFAAVPEPNFWALHHVNLGVEGSVFTMNLKDAEVRLKESASADAKAVPTLQMIRQAMLTLNAPALDKLQAFLDAFSANPTPAPAGPTASSGVGPKFDWQLMSPGEAIMGIVRTGGKPAAIKTAAPVAPIPPTKLAGGSLTFSVNIHVDPATNQTIVQPTATGKDIVLSKDGVLDTIGGLAMLGELDIASKPVASQGASPTSAAPATAPSIMDEIAQVSLKNLTLDAVGSGVVLNGAISDLAHARSFSNLTADINYNSTMLWQAILPLLSKSSQESMKDVQVAGNYTRRFTVAGSLPADKPFNQAITSLNANGELLLDLLDGKGAKLQNFLFPFVLANGKVRVVLAGKPEGQNYAAPAALNGGTLSMAGATLDLTKEHPTLTLPPKTQLARNVSINALFSDTFLGGWVNNPLFVSPKTATGIMDAIINVCNDLPIDSTVNEPVASNTGVLDMSITINRIQIGNDTITKIADAVSGLTGGSTLATKSLQGDVKQFNVKVQKGNADEDLILQFGESKRPLHLTGSVAMASSQLHMNLDLPWAMFGMKPNQQFAALAGDGVNLPLTGTVSAPQFDFGAAVQKNLGAAPQNLIKNLLNGNKTGNQNPLDALKNLAGQGNKNPNNGNNPPSTQPAGQNPQDLINDIGGLFNQKKKKKDEKKQ
ncbi:MAG TPA: DUF748 domain-containing protein [Tepidisphaeraceae bacterium]|nr:DUF748 domain-containing protein [Tepidisphaeraceae bacterium]